MDRRSFLLTSLAGALAAPLAARALQAGKVYRVAWLGSGSGAGVPEPFREGLRELGYVEGRNLILQWRIADGKYDRLPALVAEIVAAGVDVIVAAGVPAARAARDAVPTIPVVFVFVGDPVAVGFAASYSRPGGNMTGLANIAEELSGKRIELITQTVPSGRKLAVLSLTPALQAQRASLAATEAAARLKGVQLQILEIEALAELDSAFSAMVRERAQALVILPTSITATNTRRLAELALHHRLPAIADFSDFASAGGLISYGPSLADLARRAATYVDRIVKGAHPATLPVEGPTRFELVINLKTAKALGLKIPPSLLARADQVIE